LFGRGLYLDIAGCSLVGFAVGGADKVARARTEQVVRRLRALADPTRLAIFDYLKTGPSSVGEISTVFSLAQAHRERPSESTCARRDWSRPIGTGPASRSR